MIIANRRVSAEEAAGIGLVTRTVDDKDLAAEGDKQAKSLASSATTSIAAARELLLASYEGALEGQLERETRNIAACGATADLREGVSAFLGRRKPAFKGA